MTVLHLQGGRDGRGIVASLLAAVERPLPESPRPVVAAFPARFPMESKAAYGDRDTGYWSGLWQLVEYWQSLVVDGVGSGEVGHGMIARTRAIGSTSRRVHLSILLPSAEGRPTAAGSPLLARAHGKLDGVPQTPAPATAAAGVAALFASSCPWVGLDPARAAGDPRRGPARSRS